MCVCLCVFLSLSVCDLLNRVHLPQLLAQREGLRACASVMCVFVLFLFVCVCVCVCVIMYLNVNTYTLGQNIFYVRDSSVQVCMRT